MLKIIDLFQIVPMYRHYKFLYNHQKYRIGIFALFRTVWPVLQVLCARVGGAVPPDNLCSVQVNIYLRPEVGICKRKKELGQESDQEKKKTRKKKRTRPRKRSRKQESDQKKKRKNFLGRVLVFLFSFINSHLRCHSLFELNL